MGWIESLVGRTLEEASTRARGESTRARELLAELAGRRLAVIVEGSPWARRPLLIECSGEALQLHWRAEESGTDEPRVDEPRADATLRGAPLSLLALTRGDPQSVIRRGQVHIEGDAVLAERFRELGTLMAPDLEDTLSRFVGRSVAHLLMRGANAAGASLRDAAWTSAHNLAEYFAHERADLVSRHEAEHFLRGVEQAREQLDRLEARLSRLEQHPGVTPGGSEPT